MGPGAPVARLLGRRDTKEPSMPELAFSTGTLGDVQGFGLGLRPIHYETILAGVSGIDWFEAISENYMAGGGRPLYTLEQVAERFPVVLHGVSMSIGSTAPLDRDYLRRLKALIARVRPRWISDHLCWTGVGGVNAHDLLPLPYTTQTLDHVVDRVRRVQDILEQPIVLENVSSYVSYRESTMTEWEFLAALAERSQCDILLDVNNIFVSAYNHGFDPLAYLAGIPVERVRQMHLAGHENHGNYIIDTHDHPVVDQVWSLYGAAVRRFGAVPTMIERDDKIPPLDVLQNELDLARAIAAEALARKAAAA